MKYLALDFNAVKAVVSHRKLQSTEFDEANNLIEFIKKQSPFELTGFLKGTNSQSGKFIVGNEIDRNRLLIFDFDSFKGFEKSNSEIITIIQKICRLAIKLWTSIGFSPCEKIIQGTNYIAVFPFSFSTGKSYKIIVDRAPHEKRQGARGAEHFLVFYDGYEKSNEEPSKAAFRAAEKEVKNIEPCITEEPIRHGGSPYVSITEAPKGEGSSSPYMGMDYWKENLTKPQKSFVFSERLGPDILKGAAGTGKTLCLTLRSINQLSEHNKNAKGLKAVFFTHSIATKNAIENLFFTNGGELFFDENKLQSIKITTLQEWCIENLSGRISATEYLDKDALEAKNTQMLYINEALDEYLTNEFLSGTNFMSDDLKQFIKNNDPWTLSTYIQNEISIYIKGRANEDFDIYKKLARSTNSIPLVTEEDFATIFYIFNLYQKKLIDLGTFDSDDITISALQETSTPIWRRRRKKEGYDVLYIDETHLFNLNELSLFHNLLKTESTNIVFTIDRAQAPNDNAISSNEVASAMGIHSDFGGKLETVFRSSNDIINLASCILASGATLFSHLANPLKKSSTAFTSEQEKICETPYIIEVNGLGNVIITSLQEVEKLSKRMHVAKNNILIISCDDSILQKYRSYAIEQNISMQFIERRGDYDAVGRAEKLNSFIVGGIDYVGGLEFDAVIIVGADKDKFPKKSSDSGEASHFVRYSAFNQLYVAITRAKYVVSFISDKSKGCSDILSAAIKDDLIVIRDTTQKNNSRETA